MPSPPSEHSDQGIRPMRKPPTHISRTLSSLDDAVESPCLEGCNIHCTFPIKYIPSLNEIRKNMNKNGISKITFTDGQDITAA